VWLLKSATIGIDAPEPSSRVLAHAAVSAALGICQRLFHVSVSAMAGRSWNGRVNSPCNPRHDARDVIAKGFSDFFSVAEPSTNGTRF